MLTKFFITGHNILLKGITIFEDSISQFNKFIFQNNKELKKRIKKEQKLYDQVCS